MVNLNTKGTITKKIIKKINWKEIDAKVTFCYITTFWIA